MTKLKCKRFWSFRSPLELSICIIVLLLVLNSGVGQAIRKPLLSDWINVQDKSRLPEEKLNFISWLVDGCYFYNITGKRNCTDDSLMKPPPEFQSFDGFYNNIFKADLGAVDTPLLRRVPPVYNDSVYAPVEKGRINPFVASKLMERSPQCGLRNEEACGSKTGKSAFLVYFGQQVVEEILDAQRPGCPPEYFNVKIPEDHEFLKNNPHKSEMPLLRSRYIPSSGNSPGNPRQQLNEITPWIDGGLIYGTSKGWADALRTDPETGHVVEHGKLATDKSGLFPARNTLRMPMANPPPPAWHKNWTQQHQTADVNRFFVLGNPRGNENAFLLAFGVVLFRWHNQFATYFHDSRPEWSGERIFQESRKWAIATYQQMVIYDWLPEWIGEPLEAYKGYDPTGDPQIEQFFQTAAMRFGHTLVTPGAYMRDYSCAGCAPISFHGLNGNHRNTDFNPTKTVRTCNIFWRPQEPLELEHENLQSTCGRGEIDNRTVADIDRLLMGLASQRAEQEDHMIVEDLRGKVFGPLEFSRRDLMAVNIQRGRDHGTPDYNTARKAFNLPRINSVDDYMKLTRTHTPKDIIQQLENVHNSTDNPWNNIDVWTGGILETAERPGPLFRAIIKDQFLRIRNADRFWFENTNWKVPRFSADQINRIKSLRVYDMIMSVTRMLPEDLQPNPFQIPTDANQFPQPGQASTTSTSCRSSLSNTIWKRSVCRRYDVNGISVTQFPCYHFAQLDSKTVPVENCTLPGSYDYFVGSEISFIVTHILLGVFVLGVVAVLVYLSKYLEKKKKVVLERTFMTTFRNGPTGSLIPRQSAKEWVNAKDGTRSVVLTFDQSKLTVSCVRGNLLRDIDFEKIGIVGQGGRRSVTVRIFKNDFVLIENPKEYDLVVQFESPFLQEGFIGILQDKLQGKMDINEVHQGSFNKYSKKVITKKIRIKKLEKFFRHVFHLDLQNDQQLHEKDLNNDIVTIELSMAEFADALGMPVNSDFVQKIFGIIDKDRNGYISFQEFFCMLTIFKKGTAEDKIGFIFQMYDVSGRGKVTLEEFKNMLKSMISAASTDIDEASVNESINMIIGNNAIGKNGFVTLQEFQMLMKTHNDTFENVRLNFEVTRNLDLPSKNKSNRVSRNMDFVRAVNELNTGYNRTACPGDLCDERFSDMTDITLPKTPTKQNEWQRWFEMNRFKIFWLSLYTTVVLAIFVERAYYYSVEREHAGLRHIAGYGVTVTRGAASAMMFCYATLLLTMCRNLITALRATFLHHWIPFDDFVAMHKYIACLALVFTFIHVIGHGVNFYSICTQTAEDLSCLFRDYHRPTHILPKYDYWAFQTITGLTGILLVIHAAIIFIFATPFARKHAFRAFWITHQTYPLWYVLIILHGSGRLVQGPLFLNFLLGPLTLFVLDKVVTVGRENMEIPVVEAQLLPSNVTKLKIFRPNGFEFKSGQWIRLACLSLNPNEFHPFTISSAPHEPYLTVHIRAVGPFTTNIRQIYESETPKIYLDGPYGENHQDWYRFEVAVLIGGGIGVTPFASILKDVAANPNFRNCKKIYFLWVTRTQRQFEWIVDIVRDVENHNAIEVHVFISQLYDKFDLRTVLLYICEQNFKRVSNRSLFTGLKSATHFGRPNFKKFFKYLQSSHKEVNRFGIFSCGPLPMCKNVADSCVEINNESENKTIFQHHYEQF